MSSVLKSDQLIKTIKRRSFIPNSQETFTDEDFLEMATEEVNLHLVPLIQRMHEEHLVYFEEVDLVPGQLRYAIPARAHGNKLRDVALIDDNGNAFEMYRYSLTEISDFSNTTAYINSRGFYLENNDVILCNFETNIGQKLRMYFYMRPNMLVTEDKGAAIVSISNLDQIDYINPASGVITAISTGTRAVITSANHGLSQNSLVFISGSDSTPSVNGFYEASVIDSNSFSIGVTTTLAGSTGNWQLATHCKGYSVSVMPDEFPTITKFDFVQNVSPNKILNYDVAINSIDQTSKTLYFRTSEVPLVTIGSYMTKAEETIVPNIPTELHPILAQRVAVACLEAMGDEQNKQSAERKLASMEKDAGTFLDNRVEGANVKIKSRHSPLVNTLNTLGRRNRRW
jgi:hypothetical protein